MIRSQALSVSVTMSTTLDLLSIFFGRRKLSEMSLPASFATSHATLSTNNDQENDFIDSRDTDDSHDVQDPYSHGRKAQQQTWLEWGEGAMMSDAAEQRILVNSKPMVGLRMVETVLRI